MAVKSNDQRLLDRTLEDQRRLLAPNQRMDDFFNYFAASTALQDLDLDIDELRDGIVDGSHDCGVDGLWVFVDDRYVSANIERHVNVRAKKILLVILQAKTSAGYQETAFEKLHYHLPLLLDMDRNAKELSDSTNAKLLDRTGRFLNVLEALASSFPEISIRVIYATRSVESPHPNVQAKGNKLARDLAKVASQTKCHVDYLGAAELRELSARGASTVSEMVFMETPMSTSLGEGYVCLVRLDEYYNFITSPNDALRLELFESNVRDYAGRTSVNTAIEETLRSNHREDFWWFNNGVTIVADEVRIAGKKIVVRDPQIVNGLQTSHEIFNHFQSSGHHNDRSVLVRVMVPPSSGRARDVIIRATNSQTQLPPGALRATEKVQKDIEEALARDGYYYERRANYYKNLGVPLEQVVSMSRLAREYTALVVGEPHTALTYSETLLLEDSHYYKVFSTDNDIDLYSLVLDTHMRIGEFIARFAQDRPLLGDTAENWRYHVAYMSSFTLTRLRRPTQRDILNIRSEHLTDALLGAMVNLLDREYRTALRGNRTQGIDRVARSQDFTTKLRQATIAMRRFKIDH
ncbi:AIPR family protein [Streptomyces sp. S1A1-8]|uniref:AIPR family protein n=1 Tax=unclassified Streptomyces TaxID=2593676 RepID=UPI0011649AEF|nr:MULTISPECIES: AIPR family protein [unclassified Streptomyces]QDO01123.1 AIPR family protein [Streptomyces sp. RLB1-9]QDO22853.1 AIPR family protein [Streptomyces sp. S1A1-8]QDO32980.1 AIPR family protein [Streptomyces sp. S1A1-3]